MMIMHTMVETSAAMLQADDPSPPNDVPERSIAIIEEVVASPIDVVSVNGPTIDYSQW